MISEQAKIESLLFVSGSEGITAKELAQLTGLLKATVLEYLELLKNQYLNNKNCALMILQANEHFRLGTKPALAPLIEKFFIAPNQVKLSKAALETLAIIAYQQPITRLKLEEIRGVKCEKVLQTLETLELIKKAGRLELPGRPVVYQTTDQFLNYFGIASLNYLPAVDESLLAAEQEDEFLTLFRQVTED